MRRGECDGREADADGLAARERAHRLRCESALDPERAQVAPQLLLPHCNSHLLLSVDVIEGFMISKVLELRALGYCFSERQQSPHKYSSIPNKPRWPCSSCSLTATAIRRVVFEVFGGWMPCSQEPLDAEGPQMAPQHLLLHCKRHQIMLFLHDGLLRCP